MSNKRILKRKINDICSELFADCIASSLYGDQKRSEQEIKELLTSILRIHSDFISRISHPQPAMSPKKYFKKLIDDFNKQVDEIIDQISSVA